MLHMLVEEHAFKPQALIELVSSLDDASAAYVRHQIFATDAAGERLEGVPVFYPHALTTAGVYRAETVLDYRAERYCFVAEAYSLLDPSRKSRSEPTCIDSSELVTVPRNPPPFTNPSCVSDPVVSESANPAGFDTLSRPQDDGCRVYGPRSSPMRLGWAVLPLAWLAFRRRSRGATS
jgi:hypothetical protein